MRTAFKEWAIVVDALGRGEQIIILRKGGIHEGRDGFRAEHEQFFLFPTLFHQQRDGVTASARQRFDDIQQHLSPATVRIQFHAQVVSAFSVGSLENVGALRGQHIWTDPIIQERFAWGAKEGLHAMALRVFRLPHAIDLPVVPAYGGCRSWIELERDIDIAGSQPVVGDAAFGPRLHQFTRIFSPAPAGTRSADGSAPLSARL